MKTMISTLVFICFSQTAAAETYAMFGGTDCGQWMTEKTNQRKAWLMGYMSGLSSMNYLSGGKINALDKANSADQIFLWMDNYCKNNPLKSVYQGGNDLFIELMKKN